VRISRFLWTLFLGLLLVVGCQALFRVHPPDPEDLPWTPLDLRASIGLFTGRKLAALQRDPALCHALLKEAGVRFTLLPARHHGERCGWDDAVRLTGRVSPSVPLACPLAAGMSVWLRRVVQPAAAEMLGSRVPAVEHFGSYACRRIGGAGARDWSEHAFANAVDIAGFRLADGRRITVARDWRSGPSGAFLHKVRDGGCRLFATTLSPDHNRAHRDHLHFDGAPRGELGWRMCR
jgi:hypothetical protein